MALSILDGNQSATTLSTILSSGQHITAHTVVSLGTQAITDIVNATSASLTNTQLRASAVTIAGTVTANVVGFNSAESFGTGVIQDISDIERDTIRASLWIADSSAPNGTATDGQILSQSYPMPISGTVTVGSLPNISGTVTIGSALPTGTNRIGVVTIGAGTVTLGASTSQIGSVTASISGTVPVSGTFFQATQPVSLATLPALVAGTAQIGSVTASISNSVVTFYPLQGTTVSNTNFNSTTASTTLVSAVAGREVLTVFNEGAGNLFISAGATATTISYQVRLSAGDYWECPAGQLSLAHVAVFATAGTARVTEVS
jgi:hypothetical protein